MKKYVVNSAMSGMSGMAGIGFPIIYYIKDNFTTDRAAGSVDGTAAEPGPGTRDVTDTGNKLYITGGNLVWQELTTPASDPLLVYQSQSRQSGLAFAGVSINPTSGDIRCGFLLGEAFLVHSSGIISLYADKFILSITSISLPVTVHSITRSTGTLFIVGNKLVWVSIGDNGNPTGYVSGNNIGSVADKKVDGVRLGQLPAPFTDDYGLATDCLAGARSAGDTFSHESDCLLEFTVDTLPSSGQIEYEFRRQDASNKWRVTIDSSGDLDLDEVVSGTPTQRGTAAAAVSNGDRIVVIADDDDISVYYDSTLAFSYASATNFKTETSGELETEGTGGAVDDIVSWPRTLSGKPKAILDQLTRGQ